MLVEQFADFASKRAKALEGAAQQQHWRAAVRRVLRECEVVQAPRADVQYFGGAVEQGGLIVAVITHGEHSGGGPPLILGLLRQTTPALIYLQGKHCRGFCLPNLRAACVGGRSVVVTVSRCAAAAVALRVTALCGGRRVYRPPRSAGLGAARPLYSATFFNRQTCQEHD